MANIEHLPDNILLEIFTYLPVKELCISGRVCRRWRRVVRDNKLWRHVDLLPYRLDLKRMWKVIRSHFSECLLSIKIKGFLDTGTPKWKKHSLSNAMLNDLSERCPNIKEIHLHCCNTENLDIYKLPKTITTLVLHGCSWKPNWFKNGHKALPDLTHLDVTKCIRVDDSDLKDFTQCIKLKTLILNECYRVTCGGFCNFTKNTNMVNLEQLEVGMTTFNEVDLAFHHMTRNLTNLRMFNISGCAAFSAGALDILISGLKKLRILNLAYCKKIDFDSLSGMTNLRKSPISLTLSERQLLQHTKEEMESALGGCIISVIPQQK